MTEPVSSDATDGDPVTPPGEPDPHVAKSDTVGAGSALGIGCVIVVVVLVVVALVVRWLTGVW